MSGQNSSQKEAAINGSVLAQTVANLPKISRSIPVAIPAGSSINGQVSPGQVQIMSAGTRFYVRACSAPILIQSQRAGNAGSQNIFGAAQGQTVSGGFEQLNISNPSLLPIVALVWVGFEDFINDQLTLDNVSNPSIVWPTAPIPNIAATILIPDLSGTKVTIDGKAWYLLSRQAVLVGNPDSGATFVLQGKAVPVTTAPFPGFPVYPLTSLNMPAAGNFSISAGGGNINAYVNEIYTAFSA